MRKKYKIAWLPGDGIGVDVLEAAKIVLDRVQLDAEYLPGDIGQKLEPWMKPVADTVQAGEALCDAVLADVRRGNALAGDDSWRKRDSDARGGLHLGARLAVGFAGLALCGGLHHSGVGVDGDLYVSAGGDAIAFERLGREQLLPQNDPVSKLASADTKILSHLLLQGDEGAPQLTPR